MQRATLAHRCSTYLGGISTRREQRRSSRTDPPTDRTPGASWGCPQLRGTVPQDASANSLHLRWRPCDIWASCALPALPTERLASNRYSCPCEGPPAPCP